MAFNLTVLGGKSTRRYMSFPCRVTNVFFDHVVEGSANKSGLKIAKILGDGSKVDSVNVCELVEGESENQSMAFDLPENCVVEFEVTGTSTLHIIGGPVPGRIDIVDLQSGEEIVRESVQLQDTSNGAQSKELQDKLSLPEDKYTPSEQQTTSKKRNFGDDDDDEEQKSGSSSSVPKRALKRQKGPQGETTSAEVMKSSSILKGKAVELDNSLVDIEVPVVDIGGGHSMVDIHNSTSMAPQVTYIDIVHGQGSEVKFNSTVTVKFTGTLLDGTVFGACRNATPITIVMGTSKYVKGWQFGMLGMKEGGRRIIMVPPAYGYRDTDRGTVPAGSTLVIALLVRNMS